MAGIFRPFEWYSHAYIFPNLGEHGVHAEVGIWERISAIMTDEVHQPIVREIPHEPTREAIEGAYPIDIDCVLSYVS